MRLDKYLKVCRIFKRRTVSKDIISFGQVSINNKKTKPSSEVKIGDHIKLNLSNKEITIEVLSIDDKIKKNEVTNLYKIIDEKEIKSPEES
ncbi:MAG: RNA-binding S4 domain-containing protein [Erysipelotrichaceae bacterium]|nr:RNA-binding S4 domain-containing protein [Erysipelotrichaceae bacterium]